MKNIDDVLFDALSPELEADESLNRRILGYHKEDRIVNMKKIRRKSFPAAAAIAVAALMATSVTAFAAWRYLSSREVAMETADERLANEFEKGNLLNEYETQNYGGYDITLLGIVSGQEISDHLSKDDYGNVDGDKTYVALAISNADGSPMPDSQSDDFNPTDFFASPYIKGLNPVEYNAYTLGGGFNCFVSNGVQYRILETDNVECFADRGIYIGVSEGMAYNNQAYNYDAESGVLSRNEEFKGVNALFTLPVDPSKADSERANAIIDAIENPEDDGNMESFVDQGYATEVEHFMAKLTPENINEYANPVESTRKIVKPDKDGMYTYSYEMPDGISGTSTQTVEYEFPDGQIGMNKNFGCIGGEDGLKSLLIETHTLNADGTVTCVIYRPNVN